VATKQEMKIVRTGVPAILNRDKPIPVIRIVTPHANVLRRIKYNSRLRYPETCFRIFSSENVDSLSLPPVILPSCHSELVAESLYLATSETLKQVQGDMLDFYVPLCSKGT
jgi:hypothetical protein